jgi:hypothetical protein
MLSCSHSPIQGFSIGVNEFKLFKTEGDRGGERKGKHGAPKQIAMVSGGSARPHATGKYIMLTGSAGFGSTALTSPWMIGQRQPSLCAPATGPAALALERNAARPLQQLDCGVGGGTARPVRNVPQGASPDEAVTEFTAAGGAGTGGDGVGAGWAPTTKTRRLARPKTAPALCCIDRNMSTAPALAPEVLGLEGWERPWS